MNTVERILEILHDRRIPVSKLERACDFSNGYLRNLQKGTMPADKLERVANYLGVSVFFLMTGEEGYYLDPKSASMAQEMFEDPDMRLLFDTKREMSPENFHKVIDIITAFRDLEKSKENADGNV